MRTYEQITSGYKKARNNPRQEPSRNDAPCVVVNGEALNLTLDTELRRVENTAFKKNR